jgi:alkyl sulfatase BDS1-like metallo-beta-lactamase superfamily hydrolase
MHRNGSLFTALALGAALHGTADAQTPAKPPVPKASKPATAAARNAHQKVRQTLTFADREDFEEAQRGFLARPETLTIKHAKGDVVWDLESYKKYIEIEKPAPDSVNPSLWRNAQLDMAYGLSR